MTVSCSNEQGPESDIESKYPYLQEISVSRAPLAVGEDDLETDGENTDPDPAEPDPEPEVKDPYDGEEVFESKFQNDKSVLYVSQRTTRIWPFLATEPGDLDANEKETATKTYKYIYSENKFANWSEGYNFKPDVPDGFTGSADANPYALNWEEVSANRSVGNGFPLYAMYYHNPDDYQTYEVQHDQSKKEDLLRSDIQAAYHSTSALYSRVRFKLFHLMVYFKINLYVPVYTQAPFDDPNADYSGYGLGQLIEAEIRNVCPTFSINWAANISSDTSLSVDLVPANPLVEPEDPAKPYLYDIAMYSHRHEGDEMITEPRPGSEDQPEDPGDEPGSGGNGDGNGGNNDGDEDGDEGDEGGEGGGETPADDKGIRPVKETWINVSQFLPSDMLGIQPLDYEDDKKTMYDHVYQFSFSVIVPEQYTSFTDQDNPGWLHFKFSKPGGIYKHYYFQTGFAGPGDTNKNPNSVGLAPTKGTLQILNIYLPRKGDQAILIGADVQEWDEMETDMNLPRREED